MQFGRTENVKNCLEPDFAKTFEVDYYFEEVQNIRIAVYDLDNKTEELGDDDFLGQLECTLGQVSKRIGKMNKYNIICFRSPETQLI